MVHIWLCWRTTNTRTVVALLSSSSLLRLRTCPPRLAGYLLPNIRRIQIQFVTCTETTLGGHPSRSAHVLSLWGIIQSFLMNFKLGPSFCTLCEELPTVRYLPDSLSS
ncbi:hypothetical protein C8J57DRAFT_1341520 [Mycena rebaudengoi]|nr:hypothetical protein C8J57DRAFT_1341520 [Mycena rebaudengoi]